MIYMIGNKITEQITIFTIDGYSAILLLYFVWIILIYCKTAVFHIDTFISVFSLHLSPRIFFAHAYSNDLFI